MPQALTGRSSIRGEIAPVRRSDRSLENEGILLRSPERRCVNRPCNARSTS
jgi:hypothetical protein